MKVKSEAKAGGSGITEAAPDQEGSERRGIPGFLLIPSLLSLVIWTYLRRRE